jgi:hypothetical protein
MRSQSELDGDLLWNHADGRCDRSRGCSGRRAPGRALRDLLQTWTPRTATFEPEDREMLKSVVSSATLDLSSPLSRFASKRLEPTVLLPNPATELGLMRIGDSQR